MILPTFESTGSYSYEQFLRFTRELEKQTDLFRCELLRGRIYMTPPAGGPHGKVQANLFGRIWTLATNSGVGDVFGSSTGYRLPSGDVVEPDVAFISNARLSDMPPLQAGAFLEVVPDLVVEIVSPSDPERDLVEKRAIYEANGVSEYWIVDPSARTLLQLVRQDGRFVDRALSRDDVVESIALGGLRIELRIVFDGLS